MDDEEVYDRDSYEEWELEYIQEEDAGKNKGTKRKVDKIAETVKSATVTNIPKKTTKTRELEAHISDVDSMDDGESDCNSLLAEEELEFSSDDENSENNDERGLELLGDLTFKSIKLGEKPRFTVNKPFSKGTYKGYYTLNQFESDDPGNILLKLYIPVIHEIIDCCEENTDLGLKISEFFVYKGIQLMMTYLRLPCVKDYWEDSPFFTWKQNLSTLMTLRRFNEIRGGLKFYKDGDSTADRGFKVTRIVSKLKETIKSISKNPGEHLSLDEAMGACNCSRNPIFVSVPRKPHEGFRFFALVDYETKICINFDLDTKALTSDNCKNTAGGMPGKVVANLIHDTQLPGKNYKLYMDRFYGSIELAKSLVTTSPVLPITTLAKSRAADNVILGKAKIQRPTAATPRGTIKCAYRNDGIFQYGFMDSAACYFIDTAYGPEDTTNSVSRKLTRGVVHNFPVPVAIKNYNDYKGGVDVLDQLRNGKLGYDVNFRTNKWTVRMEEILFGFAEANAYNIYRYHHKSGDNKFLTHKQFHWRCAEFFLYVASSTIYMGPRSDVIRSIPLHMCSIVEQPIGSGEGNRRRRGLCRGTIVGENGKKHEHKTHHGCLSCDQFICPMCFNDYHNPKTIRRQQKGTFNRTMFTVHGDEVWV